MSSEAQGLREQIAATRLVLSAVTQELSSLIQSCPHQWVKDRYGGMDCSICGTKGATWYCPDSPDHHCYYYSREGMVRLPHTNSGLVAVPADHNPEHESSDWCIFCGNPEERL